VRNGGRRRQFPRYRQGDQRGDRGLRPAVAVQRPMAEGVKLLNAIQDVYLTKEVTIA
jgi:hypothetical protein